MNNKECVGVPKGTSEVFGPEMDIRISTAIILEDVFRQFGFDPLHTPTLEFSEVFNGHHGEGEELLFNLKDKDLTSLVLRYDLTVPLARFFSSNVGIPVPFKRYQIASVFRDDEVDKGHFREFTQCDGDIIGSDDLSIDSEIINLAFCGLTKLGFKNFSININHRKILSGISQKTGTSPLSLQRGLDGVNKFSESWEHHNKAHYQQSFHGHIKEILEGYNITGDSSNLIIKTVSFKGDFESKINFLKENLSEYPEAMEGIIELEEIFSYLTPEVKARINLDISLARGADYYTGFILEGSIPDLGIGSVLGGGRFDNLIEALGGESTPAVGMAFGFERIIECLKELNIDNTKNDGIKVLVVSTTKEDRKELIKFTKLLRKRKGACVDYMPMIGNTEEVIRKYAKQRNFDLVITKEDTEVKVIQTKEEKGLDFIHLLI